MNFSHTDLVLIRAQCIQNTCAEDLIEPWAGLYTRAGQALEELYAAGHVCSPAGPNSCPPRR